MLFPRRFLVRPPIRQAKAIDEKRAPARQRPGSRRTVQLSRLKNLTRRERKEEPRCPEKQPTFDAFPHRTLIFFSAALLLYLVAPLTRAESDKRVIKYVKNIKKYYIYSTYVLYVVLCQTLGSTRRLLGTRFPYQLFLYHNFVQHRQYFLRKKTKNFTRTINLFPYLLSAA